MLPALVLLVGIFLIPVIALLGISVQESVPIRRYEAGFTFGSYQRFFTDPWYLNQWATTFKIMSIVTAIVVVLGYPLSYMIWRAKGRRKGILLAVVLLPLFTNIIARIYAWLVVLAKEGPINWVLTKTPFVDDPILLNFNFWTVILGVTYVAIPYFILILWSSLEGVDWNLVESARTMGAGKFRSILETVVPLSAAGFAGALAVTMTWGTGAYAEPTVLGSPKEWTTGIEAGHQILRAYDWPYGAALSFVLVSSTMLAIIVMYRLVVRKRWMV
jgi:ABC-type spermidine/putrescine transport system permease subunit I